MKPGLTRKNPTNRRSNAGSRIRPFGGLIWIDPSIGRMQMARLLGQDSPETSTVA